MMRLNSNCAWCVNDECGPDCPGPPPPSNEDRARAIREHPSFHGWVEEQFWKSGGRPIADIALEAGVSTDEIERLLRESMRWFAETEALAGQAPNQLSAAFDSQVAGMIHAADADLWARGYRAGLAVGKGEASIAVSHMGNAIIARSTGLTRETR